MDHQSERDRRHKPWHPFLANKIDRILRDLEDAKRVKLRQREKREAEEQFIREVLLLAVRRAS